MNKQEFLDTLEKKLSVLPKSDIEERLNFYSEIIDDYIEEGLTEEEAISKIGSLDEIVTQILADYSPSKSLDKKEEKPQKRASRSWEIVLLILGLPLWLPLLIAAFAVIFSLYASLWAIIISVWATFGSVIGCSVGSLITGIVYIINANVFGGIAMIGVGLICAGVALLLFFGCKLITRLSILPLKPIFRYVKKLFTKKEAAQ